MEDKQAFTTGFSLVELSIVLVILGLLTGGILSGQSLIHAAELRSVTTQYQSYQSAIMSFRDKYFALPGDMPNATKFWGDDNAACPDPAVANGVPGTCNGNGDGIMNAAAAGGATGEIFQIWKQLTLAGLLEGSYTGLAGSGGTVNVLFRTNSPAAKINNAGWGVSFNSTPSDPVNAFVVNYGNYLLLGGATANGFNGAIAITPEDAWNIDNKMDDGEPGQGKIIARFWNNLCSAADDGSSANTDLNASYRLTDSSIQCGLYFINAF